ncbi:MAG: hypothetical protein VX951_03175 [Planctomycetota bacterium]|nr:hypothetical protein [Planctomycetota bacterium]
MDWVSFWKYVLFGAVGVFALMSLWVIVAGFGDIQRMFGELRRQRDSHTEDDVQ